MLGPDSFGGLAWVWTLATIYGFGLATPTEQVVIQRSGARRAGTIRTPVGVLIGGALLAVTGLAITGPRVASVHSFGPLVPSAVLAVAGWSVVAVARGRLAARGDMVAYGAVLLMESAMRLGLVALAWTMPAASPALLGLAVGLPTLLAGAVAALMTRGRDATSPEETRGGPLSPSPHLSFVVVACGYQACLNGPPLLLGWGAPSLTSAALGAFVVANTWFRSPTILTGGTSVHALGVLTRTWSTGDRDGFARHLRRSLGVAATTAAGASAVCLAAAPLALPLLYGTETGLDARLALALACSTVLSVAAVMVGTALLAIGHGADAAVAWMVGALLTSALVLTSGGLTGVLNLAIVLGPLATFVLGAARLTTRRAASVETLASAP